MTFGLQETKFDQNLCQVEHSRDLAIFDFAQTDKVYQDYFQHDNKFSFLHSDSHRKPFYLPCLMRTSGIIQQPGYSLLAHSSKQEPQGAYYMYMRFCSRPRYVP